ncbi:coatomer subunit delta [Yamadazyma tenuis]|uniref:Coatomer subunit delta n=1 Tax=Candida tenuis (strain ATCC 10573 / BCRC 21748 / CBS 615 / JCM 9827 / NBRC 10315 / NRRL Y-1498 / VKM Y-70) TaxID=590646 RepID=G3AZN7_CANTC|nr:uncharacterized protein CANTEDRAFT_112504 [Yamadazyma tenuis ATCC 10573]EGV65631.1 hypothetical protein CANTEDRAFT_112504 [Yamadazyma tenuis ATCC 10573]WEJ96061.1 coatomer subunit delta [Yamadazyma tenuis]
MVVLAASICTRGGKALLSRQFRDINKDKITSLLSSFPSLISNSSSQHTAVEDDNIRYVYQPLEELYVVLLTNKHSNILQDIDTLHLFVSTISNLLRTIDEREIFDNAFEILSSFDEIINNGYKENLTLSQVQSFLEMDSHEEKIQEIIERNKEMEANEERKRRAKEIQRKELAKKNLENQFNRPYGFDEAAALNNHNQPSYQPPAIVDNSIESPSSGGYLNKPLTSRSGGLQLGKKPAGRSEASQPLLFNPATNTAVLPNSRSVSMTPTPVVNSAPKVPNNGILVTINEKFNAQLQRDGSILSTEVKGDLQLRINNEDLSYCKILLKTTEKSSEIQYKTHPNVDRNLFQQQHVIGLKDKTKPFPSNDQSLGVLRWRCAGKSDESKFLPILITIWCNPNGDSTDVTIEYELTSEFLENNTTNSSIDDIKIILPVQGDIHLKEENSQISYNIEDIGTVFNIGSISTDDPQGSFEFTVDTPDEDALFPMDLQFTVEFEEITDSDNSFGKVQVLDIVASQNEDEESLPFDLRENLATESYQIV